MIDLFKSPKKQLGNWSVEPTLIKAHFVRTVLLSFRTNEACFNEKLNLKIELSK